MKEADTEPATEEKDESAGDAAAPVLETTTEEAAAVPETAKQEAALVPETASEETPPPPAGDGVQSPTPADSQPKTQAAAADQLRQLQSLEGARQTSQKTVEAVFAGCERDEDGGISEFAIIRKRWISDVSYPMTKTFI